MFESMLKHGQLLTHFTTTVIRGMQRRMLTQFQYSQHSFTHSTFRDGWMKEEFDQKKKMYIFEMVKKTAH